MTKTTNFQKIINVIFVICMYDYFLLRLTHGITGLLSQPIEKHPAGNPGNTTATVRQICDLQFKLC